MHRYHEYMKQADEAEKFAARSNDPVVKDTWLKIAANYRELADVRKANIIKMPERGAHVLIADTPEASIILKGALQNRVLISLAATAPEAIRALKAGGINAVIVGVHFDQSRMFELIRSAQSNGYIGPAPIICVRVLPENFGATVVEALHIACGTIGAVAYLDWFEIENDVGSRKVQAEFSHRLLSALSA